MKRLKKKITTLVLLLMLLIGLGLILYPSVSDWWNTFRQSKAVDSYSAAVEEMDTAAYEALLAEADAYNAKLAQTGILWNMTDEEKAEYEKLLDVGDDGIMGYISIPRISVRLPVYHGTDTIVLQRAIGHLEGTSLPVGGTGTHCLLSGHRGLPSARLFTDLDKLAEGDTFTLTVLNRTLIYEVDQIRVVEPTDLASVQIEAGQDLCTLITCTPYGINTHRLLVRGHRIEAVDGSAAAVQDARQIRMINTALLIAIPTMLILVSLMLLATHIRRKRAADRRRIRNEHSRDKSRRTGSRYADKRNPQNRTPRNGSRSTKRR